MAFYCFYFIFYQKMQPWWSYVHKKYYQKRRYNGGWRLRWKITGERPEVTRWSCLHIKGCPDMFWHSPGSPQPHLRILKWRGGTSWHRSPGCQTCFGFLLPWALNIKHTVFPPRPSVHDPQRYTVFQEITQLPHFFFLSIPFLITQHGLYSARDYSSFQHCMAFPEITCWSRLDSFRKGTQTPRDKWDRIEQYGVFRPLESYGYEYS